jgi:arylsulfatase A-like enzyme
VAEILLNAGVTTAGVADTPFYLNTGFNLDRGFRHFYDIPGQQPLSGKRTPLIPAPRLTEFDHCAPRTMTVAEQCLERLREHQPFFLWVDTWDPHEPWDAPPWYVERYKPDYDGRVVWPPYCAYTDAGLSDEDLATAIACYCGKLSMVDRWIGRLLDRLETLRLADDTVVAFLSDHGFYLGERGGQLGKLVRHIDESGAATWLRSPLYGEVIDVPFWLRLRAIAWSSQICAHLQRAALRPDRTQLGRGRPPPSRAHSRHAFAH